MATIADVAVNENKESVSPPVEDIPPANLLTTNLDAHGLVIEKVRLDASDYTRFLEIRPPLRRLPNEVPIYVEMVDANRNPCAIQVSDGVIVQALRLSPNPNNMTINSSKIINRYSTMTRWVEDHWGDDLDTIGITGTSFSFMANISETHKPGLTATYRRDTEAYKMMKELIRFYRMNGCIYQDATQYATEEELNSGNENFTPVSTFLNKYPNFIQRHPREGMIRERLYIRLTLDYVSFIGFFESFDLTEDSSSPYMFTYSASFKSERTKYILG
jgi:hypothetical protein